MKDFSLLDEINTFKTHRSSQRNLAYLQAQKASLLENCVVGDHGLPMHNKKCPCWWEAVPDIRASFAIEAQQAEMVSVDISAFCRQVSWNTVLPKYMQIPQRPS